MVRALVLQHMYNLSDEAVEYQLLDRLSFQRFRGLLLHHGFIARGGRIIDATLVEAPATFPQSGEKKAGTGRNTTGMDGRATPPEIHRSELNKEAWQKLPQLQAQYRCRPEIQTDSQTSRQHCFASLRVMGGKALRTIGLVLAVFSQVGKTAVKRD